MFQKNLNQIPEEKVQGATEETRKQGEKLQQDLEKERCSVTKKKMNKCMAEI